MLVAGLTWPRNARTVEIIPNVTCVIYLKDFGGDNKEKRKLFSRQGK